MRGVSPSLPRRRNLVAGTIVPVFLLLLTFPSASSAQLSNTKRWGVTASIGAPWTANSTLQQRLVWGPADYPNHEGRELSVGFVRGTTRGGELAVSFVRKPFNGEPRRFQTSESGCADPPFQTFCSTYTEDRTIELFDVLVDGVEVTFFIPVYTAVNRVQFGVNVGGGIGFPSGTAREVGSFTSTFTQPGFPPEVLTEMVDEEYEAAGEIIQSVVPLIKTEFQASILLGPSVKLKVSAGLNAPSAAAIRIGAVYFFGAP